MSFQFSRAELNLLPDLQDEFAMPGIFKYRDRHPPFTEAWYESISPTDARVENGKVVIKRAKATMWHLNNLQAFIANRLINKRSLQQWCLSDEKYVSTRTILSARICYVTNLIRYSTYIFFWNAKALITRNQILNK